MAISKADSKYQAVARSVNCYFCNEVFDERAFQGHITQCGSVLDPCPKKCGVYIQRKNKSKHISECYIKPTSSRPVSLYGILETDTVKRRNKNTTQLDTDIEKLKLSLEFEKQSRQDIQRQLLTIQNLHLKYIQHNKELNVAYDSLKNNWYEEIEKRKMLIHKTQLELEQVYKNYRIMEEWKNGIECDIQQIKYQLQENTNKVVDVQYKLKDFENEFVSFDEVKSNVNLLNKKLETEQIKWQLEFISLSEKFDKFQDFFQEENAAIGALWTDHTSDIKQLKNSFENQNSLFNDLRAKYHNINFELKNVGQSNLINTDSIESQNKDLKNIHNELAQLREDFNANVNFTSTNSYLNKNNGYLIWRIDNYTDKLDKAKQNDIVCKGPIFYSREYGYKLRLQVYLNGLGKWKNRHVLISLQVLKGEWDPLLIWPCNIEAKVTLRDQSTSQGKDFIKTISAKRQTGEEENEDPHDSSLQYIFIPHTTMEKNNYIQNNTIFFEIKIIKDT